MIKRLYLISYFDRFEEALNPRPELEDLLWEAMPTLTEMFCLDELINSSLRPRHFSMADFRSFIAENPGIIKYDEEIKF